jgi:S-layer homology domain
MHQNKQRSNFQRIQCSRRMLLIGSILPISLLSTSTVRGEPVPSPINEIDRSNLSRQVAQTDRSNPPTPAIDRVPQSTEFSDVKGDWAEPFISALIAKGILQGYPDGTFKPSQLVTRAEFAAILDKAFNLQPTRSGKMFADISQTYWAAKVIEKAYKSGFLSGYNDRTFAPNRPILRIESLVSVINGNQLEPTGKLALDGVFGDAAQIPSYGQNAIVAATQRCLAVGGDYDNGKLPGGNFQPDRAATRAEVAALIHQVLVGTGRLSALISTNPANKYIASCPGGTYIPIVANAVPPQPVAEPVQPKKIDLSNAFTNYGSPVSGLNSPSAFGSNWGELFAGAGYQKTTRPQIFSTANARGQGIDDGALAFGLGLGDSRHLVGLEAVVTSNSTVRRGFFKEGAISLKLHKQFGENFALAVGSDNVITYGNDSDVGQSYYGVASSILNPSTNIGFLSNTTVSLGIGNGRYRSVGDVRLDRSTIGIFGSIGTRLSPNFSLVADWDGQDLSIGFPIGFPLGDRFGIQITPGIVDLVNRETGGSRFVISGGVGYSF